jgi:hypothetical protein
MPAVLALVLGAPASPTVACSLAQSARVDRSDAP